MLELESMELVLKFSNVLAVSCHLRFDAVGFLHHLIDNELGIPSNFEVPNPYFESDPEPIEESLVLHDIVGYWKVDPDHVFHTHAQRQDENEFDSFSLLREGSVEVHGPHLVLDWGRGQ
jgi:hypothetical protein